ncbi:MAG: N-acetylmuramoyl-L-alanine amidase, partial [Tumebacillaceae bacterium]
MKRKRAYFHTIRLPYLRLLLPSLLLVIFTVTAYSVLSSHLQTSSIIKFSPAVVMIDAGHGGYDPGVITDRGDEADIVLTIAQKLKSALEKRGIPAQLTRETDTDFAQRGQRGKEAKRTDLAKRLESTKREQAQIFVSLHANKSAEATRGGAEVFYREDMPGSKELAEAIQSALRDLPDMSPRYAKSSDYY